MSVRFITTGVSSVAPTGNVTFLNRNTAVVSGTGTINTSMSVTNSGTNRVAFAIFAWDGDSGLVIDTPSYGGFNMEACGVASNNTLSTYSWCQVFYLVNPPTGSNTLSANVPGALDVYANLIAFNGVHQTTPVRGGTYEATGNAESTGGASNKHTLTISSDTHDLTFTALIDDVGGLSTNQTLDSSNTGGNDELFSDHATTAAASVTHVWTFVSTTVAEISSVGFSIQAA